MSKHLILVIVFFFSVLLYAQDTTKTSVFTPNTSEIIGLQPIINKDEKVTIANLSETKINEAPGSIYVITAEDIERNGYRGVQEILMNVPGFNIATDVQNGTGIALRGSWANEAKILVMIDGLIMNDMAYGSFVLGGRIPLLNIQRIEIIKGASSSIYGGVAGLGVINIITKSGKTSKGSSVVLDAGVSNNALSNIRVTFANTSYLINGFEISVCGSVANGNKSNTMFTQADSTVTNFRDSSTVNNVFLQMKLKRKDLEYKVLYDDYNFQATHERITSLTRTFINEISYNKTLNKTQILASISNKNQIPWNTQYGDPLIYDVQNLKTNQFKVSTVLNYNPSKLIGVLAGAQYINDYMRFYRQGLLLYNNKTEDNFNSLALYSEFIFKSKYVNAFVGGRYDNYQTFKPNLAPRICVTKEFKHLSYKLIYGESFKIPMLQNINLAYLNSSKLVPEKIKDYQAELGVKGKQHSANFNLFYTDINDIIVFGYDFANKIESYVNEGHLALAGFEVAINNKFNKLEIRSSYSNYNVMSATSYNYLVDTFNLKKGTLAIPMHKFCTNVRFILNKKNSVLLNYIYQSEKHSYEQISVTTGEYGLINYKPTHLIDLSFHTKSLFKFFDVAVGVKNILNTNNYFNFPNATGYPTAIGMGRELFTQIKINL